MKKISWENMWLAIATIIILGTSVAMKNSIVEIIAAVTGVICVILCGYGKISNYYFATVNVILYACVSYKARYYGDVMLNLLFYLPTNIIGYFAWKKNIDNMTNEVYKKTLTKKQNVLLVLICIVVSLSYSALLYVLGGRLPLLDSMSTVLSIIAQILMIKRYAQHWALWIGVNSISIAMWIAALYEDRQGFLILLMWMTYLINSIIMYIKWKRDVKNDL